MKLHLTLDIPPLPQPLTYRQPVLLIGSCFTEHISERLAQHKFSVLSNPNGILFNPLSVADSLDSYINNVAHTHDDLFYLNDVWNSWKHHTRFSHTGRLEALQGINDSQRNAGEFIKIAGWVIITLGSAFQYYLKETDTPVANNHRAPAQLFEKRLLGIDEIVSALAATIERLHTLNPAAQVLFTISPVRHIRDGVIDNNRSKARLIEAVHQLCSRFAQAHYFPAYELVIDILRDYRYYDIDFVHPNYLATTYVWEHFVAACTDAETQDIMRKVHEIAIARAHRARFPDTDGHRRFLAAHAEKVKNLMIQYPFLDLSEELAYFSS